VKFLKLNMKTKLVPLKLLLDSEVGLKHLRKQMAEEYSEENLDFYLDVCEYQKLFDETEEEYHDSDYEDEDPLAPKLQEDMRFFERQSSNELENTNNEEEGSKRESKNTNGEDISTNSPRRVEGTLNRSGKKKRDSTPPRPRTKTIPIDINAVDAKATHIITTYIDPGSEKEINISSKIRSILTEKIENFNYHSDTFQLAKQEIMRLMDKDSYDRFLQKDESLDNLANDYFSTCGFTDLF